MVLTAHTPALLVMDNIRTILFVLHVIYLLMKLLVGQVVYLQVASVYHAARVQTLATNSGHNIGQGSSRPPLQLYQGPSMGSN